MELRAQDSGLRIYRAVDAEAEALGAVVAHPRTVDKIHPRRVDIRLSGKGGSNTHPARPVY